MEVEIFEKAGAVSKASPRASDIFFVDIHVLQLKVILLIIGPLWDIKALVRKYEGSSLSYFFTQVLILPTVKVSLHHKVLGL